MQTASCHASSFVSVMNKQDRPKEKSTEADQVE